MRNILTTSVLAAMAIGLACTLPALTSQAWADSATGLGAKGISAAEGAAVYQHVCQGCHMPGGIGATGGSSRGFPALAHDPRLKAANYPILRVLEGHGAMPWFNGMLTDGQIAAVVTYIRTHFGNEYTKPVTAAEVAAIAPPPPSIDP